MGKLWNLGLIGWITTAGYIALDQAGKAWIESAERTSNVIQYVAGKAVEVIQDIHIQIWDMAPLSDFGLEQMFQAFIKEWQSPEPLRLALLAGVSVLGWVLAWMGSKKIWDIVKNPSKGDDTIVKVTVALSTLSAMLKIPEWINIALAAGTYIISRKIGEKMLWEKYSKLIGFAATLGGYSYMTNSSAGISAVAIVGGGNLLWKLKDNVRGVPSSKKETKHEASWWHH